MTGNDINAATLQLRITDMKKKIRRSQFANICKTVYGPFLGKYGVPYGGVTGMIFPEHIDEMLLAVERFTDVHVVSFNDRGGGVNRYVPDAPFYKLCFGDKNPEIEFSGDVSQEDSTEEELEAEIQHAKSVREGKYEHDPMMMAGMSWLRNKNLKPNYGHPP